MAQSRSREQKTILAGIVWVLAFNLANIVWILKRPFGGTPFAVGVDAFGILACVLGSAWCLGTTIRFNRSRSAYLRNSSPSILMAAGLLCSAAGQAFFSYPEVVKHVAAPFPGFADLFFLAMYPLIIAAILKLPARPLQPGARIRVFLDCAMLMAAAVAFSWFFVLGPTVLENTQSLLGRIVSLSYPVLDLAMLLLALVFASREGDGPARPGACVLLAGLVIFVTGDGVYLFKQLHQTYAAGSITDVDFVIGITLIALGTTMLQPPFVELSVPTLAPGAQRDRFQVEAQPLWKLLLPYSLFLLLMSLLLYTRNMPGSRFLEQGVFISSVVLVALILLRQIMAIRENHKLNRALSKAYREAAADAGRMETMYAELHAAQVELKVSLEALTHANDRLHALATTDVLTGLPNRRAMVAAVDAQIELSMRYGHPCALIFLDLDHFKAVNDSRGHQAGDDSLSELAAFIRNALRASDIVGRWGGEEFVAILPETDPAGAEVAAQEMRLRIEQHEFTAAGGLRMTCSIGVAAFPADADDRDSLIDAADRAMYAAKQLGRNQVRVASELSDFSQPL